MQTSNLAHAPIQQRRALCTPAGICRLSDAHRKLRTHRHAVQREPYSSNLGVLQPMVEQSVGVADDPYAMQRVSVDSFSSRGYYLDGTAIFGSAVLLVVLLALTFERILGLDRFINQAIQKWKESRQYKRRNEVINARQALGDSWDSGDDKQ